MRHRILYVFIFIGTLFGFVAGYICADLKHLSELENK